MIKQIVALSRRPEFRRRLVFLEGYDMAVARSMTQGADVWLSTPRRPLEASGTSGMKAAANGTLILSTLDGWWDEAWDCGLRIADCGFDRTGFPPRVGTTLSTNPQSSTTRGRNPQSDGRSGAAKFTTTPITRTRSKPKPFTTCLKAM